MAHLEIHLFGGIHFALDGRPLTGIESDKGRALLAYLALENEMPQRRETLSGLLWPEQPEATARRCLSQALYNLRGALGQPRQTGSLASDGQADGHLLIAPQSVQLNTASSYWLDVEAFTRGLAEVAQHPHAALESCPACVERLQQAVQLYRGDFLAGFLLRGAEAFD